MNNQVSVLSAVATLPIFLWELSLGLYRTFKGFKFSPILTDAGAGSAAGSFPGSS